MMQKVLALFLILHGLIHLLWFIVPWRITAVDGLPYRTTLLAGRMNVGEGGIRLMGLLWVLGMIGFVVAGLGLLFSTSWWRSATIGTALFSCLLCILSLPESKWGALIDVAIMAVLFI